MYGLNQKERQELKDLTKELFGDCPPIMTTPDMDKNKKERYELLAKKKIELMQASLN
jgi:hypothetical protein